MKTLHCLAVAVCAATAVLLGGCGQTHVQDPWVSDQQFAGERERLAQTAAELRQRARRIQQDR
jgi:hypothetical protein